jgi:hypothetical protein
MKNKSRRDEIFVEDKTVELFKSRRDDIETSEIL